MIHGEKTSSGFFRRTTGFAVWFAVATILFLLRFFYVYLDDLARERHGRFLIRLVEEATGGYTSAVLFIFVILFALRFRLRRQNWLRRLPIYFLVLVGFSLAHTTLMAITRKVIFPLVGLGEYDYGLMYYRYLMEFSNQIMFFWFIILVTHLAAHYREARDREVQTARLQAQLAEAQLQALQSQIHPHFLFNALNTISAVIYEDVKLADTMIARLSDFLRHSLTASQAQEVTLKEELEFLNLYLDIMRPRFEERLQVGFAIQPETEEAMVPKLVLQPLVENAIKYAAHPESGSVSIKVSAARENGDVRLRVADSGGGIPAGMPSALRQGVGLSNTIQRLRHLYGDDQEFSLQNAGGGLQVDIRVPYHREPL